MIADEKSIEAMKSFAKTLFRSLKQNRKTSASKTKRLFSLLPSGLTLLDIGAAGGIEPRWEKVCETLSYIGIEPDKRSSKELNQISRSRKTYILNSFAWSEEAEVEFNLCRKPQVSSTYIPNRKLIDRYPNPARFDILKKEILIAEPLLKKLSPHKIDFIKLDIQGGELNALKGLGDKLKGCLGLEIEVEFSELYESQPLFSEVNNFLLGEGFYFSDFTNICRWERDSHNGYGRCIFGDGLWMRELDSLPLKTDEEYLKYAAICSLYGKLDEAIASWLSVKGEDKDWKEFESILLEQRRMQKKERSKFKFIQRLWSLYSPSSRIHLIE